MNYSYLLVLILWGLCSTLLADESAYTFDWSLLKTEENIRLYTSPVDGSKFKAIKAEMVLHTSLQSFVALTQDVSACPRWAHLCKQSRIQQRESDDSYIIYTINDMPWPIADREVLVKMTWQQNPSTQEVVIIGRALPTELHTKDKVIQIKQAESIWYVTPRDRHTITVVSEVYIEHEKNIPAWAANSSMIESTLQTFLNLRDLMEDQGYVPSQIDFRVQSIEP